jgi:uncharacterized protein involved in exopolysaccharide biosynthesis
LSLREAAMLQTGVLRDTATDTADDSLDIKALLRILNKYKWLLLAFALLGLAASVVKTLTSTPLYQASSTVQIERPPGRIVSFNRDVDSSQDYDDYLALPTQIELLRSRALAERVIDELNLDRSRSQAPAPGVLGGASSPASAAGGLAAGPRPPASSADRDAPWWFFLGDLKDRTVAGYENLGKPSVSDQQVLGREAVVGSFMGAVKIEPVRGSRLVRINVVSPEPAKAARVANAMAQNFMSMSMERKMESSIYARNFLQDQIKVSKARLEESERTLNTYAKANSILTLDEKTSVINQTFTDYSSALSKAEQERVKAESQYREMERSPENSAQVLDNKTVQAFKEQKGEAGGRIPGEPGHLQARLPQDAADQGADHRAGAAHQGRDCRGAGLGEGPVRRGKAPGRTGARAPAGDAQGGDPDPGQGRGPEPAQARARHQPPDLRQPAAAPEGSGRDQRRGRQQHLGGGRGQGATVPLQARHEDECDDWFGRGADAGPGPGLPARAH